MQSALAEHDEGIRDAELLRFIHGMLLMLDYSHPPDELIGQATLRKALAEFEAKVRAEAFEAGLKVTRGDVAQCADEIAALQGALRELRDAVEPNRARLYACLDPSKYARIAMNIAAATALLEGK
jgi:hypothetical protein